MAARHTNSECSNNGNSNDGDEDDNDDEDDDQSITLTNAKWRGAGDDRGPFVAGCVRCRAVCAVCLFRENAASPAGNATVSEGNSGELAPACASAQRMQAVCGAHIARGQRPMRAAQFGKLDVSTSNRPTLETQTLPARVPFLFVSSS